MQPEDPPTRRPVAVDPEFGERVKVLRTALGISQRELAETAGISKRSVEDYEAGSLPRGNLPKLAKALGVTPYYLAYGSEELETQLELLAATVEELKLEQARQNELTLRAIAASRRVMQTVDATLRAVLLHLTEQDELAELDDEAALSDDPAGESGGSGARSSPRPG
jgi:transcriptional regulator with XRE-family HTH domain